MALRFSTWIPYSPKIFFSIFQVNLVQLETPPRHVFRSLGLASWDDIPIVNYCIASGHNRTVCKAWACTQLACSYDIGCGGWLTNSLQRDCVTLIRTPTSTMASKRDKHAECYYYWFLSTRDCSHLEARFLKISVRFDFDSWDCQVPTRRR